MIGQNEILIHREGKSVTDFSHDFGLLHRVNTQLTFEVLVHLDEIGRVSCVVNHDRNEHLLDVAMGTRRNSRSGRDGGFGRRRSGWFDSRSLCAGRCSNRCRSGSATFHALDVTDHVVQRRMIGQDEVLVDGKGEFVANIGHDFRLLHRINAQFTLEVLVEFNEISRIPRVFNHNGHDRGRHFSVVNHGRR